MPALAQAELPLDTGNLPALIILGRDEANKPHAAWFDQTELTGATSAAALMGMMALPVTSEEVRALAGRLPHGKLFSGSGRAFVPFTKQTTYDDLIVHVPMAQQVRPLRLVRAEAEGNETPPAGDTRSAVTLETHKTDGSVLVVPQDWSKIGPGCVVLAIADDKADGWFESVILKAKGHTSFTLRWRDYPEEQHFERPLAGLALLHPSRSATE